MDFQSLGNTSVIGLQWGDEGKGKIVDLLTGHFDVVVRYAGGANAGHTVRVGGDKFALHLLPSGILRPDVLNVVGPNVVLDLEIICGEIDEMRRRGVEIGRNLLISNHAHLVMPYHKLQDRLEEERLGLERIGTTAKGIGPCNADKVLRASAFRVADLYRPDEFRSRLARVVDDRNRVFAALYGSVEPMDANAMASQLLELAERIRPHVRDATLVIHESLAAGRRLLFEGAQGSLLDLNHGTFPYVTSTSCVSGGVAASVGIPPSAINSYVGVIKAYATRVGSGPFPTEQANEIGDRIRERGHEYGTTTGRPRRCGWFDAFSARYSVDLSGITQLAVMHLDTLGTFDEVKICTGYRYQGRELPMFPPDADILAAVEPIYETLPGWNEDASRARTFGDLPASARRYVERLESLLGVAITLISVGPDRAETIHR